jgi:hypothetical protein
VTLKIQTDLLGQLAAKRCPSILVGLDLAARLHETCRSSFPHEQKSPKIVIDQGG